MTVVGVLLATIYIHFKGKSLKIENANSKGKINCKQIKDVINTTIDDVKVSHTHSVLKSVYQDQCSKSSSSKDCAEAQELIECLGNYLNPERQQADAPRTTKAIEASGGAAAVSSGTAQK